MKRAKQCLRRKYYSVTENIYLNRGCRCRSLKQLAIKSSCWGLLIVALTLFSTGLALFEKAKHDPHSK